MRTRGRIGCWTSLGLAAATLRVWGVALQIFLDVDKLFAR